MTEPRSYGVALHEAAHVVVGCAVGLKFRKATVGDRPLHGTWREYGAVWFVDAPSHPMLLSLALAAGCAWDRMLGEESAGDFALLRQMDYTRREIDALVIASSAILHGRAGIHAKVARALVEHDLTASDLALLVES